MGPACGGQAWSVGHGAKSMKQGAESSTSWVIEKLIPNDGVTVSVIHSVFIVKSSHPKLQEF